MIKTLILLIVLLISFLLMILGVMGIVFGAKKAKCDSRRMQFSDLLFDLFDGSPSKEPSGQLLIAEGVMVLIGTVIAWGIYFFF